MEAREEPAGLVREWIRVHQVCWELMPYHEMHEHAKIQVGFELTLFARHVEPLSNDPGCPECSRIYERLHEIALRALPKDVHAGCVEVSPFDAAFHLRPETGWLPEVTLTLQLVHKHGTLAGADEQRWAVEIQQQLRSLGIQPKAWSRR